MMARVLATVDCPVAAALEGGYNATLTSWLGLGLGSGQGQG